MTLAARPVRAVPVRAFPVRRLVALAVVALGLALSAFVVSAAEASPRHHRDLTVMTRNLYLGSALGPAILAPTPEDFLREVATIYRNVGATDFPRRSRAIAREVAQTRPDLVGLQEVSEWTATDPVSGLSEELDYLDVLLAALAAEGLSYSVAAVSDNFQLGPVPLSVPCEDLPDGCVLTFRDRDVILVNDDARGLRVLRSDSGRYAAQVQLPSPVPGEPPLSFDRGWASVDAKYRGKRFRFLNTHLETDVFPQVQEAQAAELLAGPARYRGRVIAVGDFNSAADGSNTASYALLTRSLRDAWTASGDGAGLTCCQSGLLDDPVPSFTSRIDLVLVRGRVSARRSVVVGDTPFQGAAPYWASDHAGVVSVVSLHRLRGHGR